LTSDEDESSATQLTCRRRQRPILNRLAPWFTGTSKPLSSPSFTSNDATEALSARTV
jgi:hypothetical protein